MNEIMRGVLLLMAMLSAALGASAQQSPREWIDMLNRSLGASYGVHVEVTTDDSEEPVAGYYIVDGDSYYLQLGVMEVYSDAKLRYEINNERKEVTEDVVNLESVDLLTNPTRAFNFVDDEFDASIVEQNAEGATLRLVPKDELLGISDIRLVLRRDGATVMPTDVSYDYEGYVVDIELHVVDTQDTSLPRWAERKANYRAYDMVSFL
ncbi:MAG: hypothetical protein IJD53_02060 [Alistipes sp.]|nr:hypothetical protein [Alistipes sp.]